MPRLRFRLRSLLLIVVLFAMACWAYWIGWPWWQEYRLVSALKQLKAGVTVDEVKQLWNGGSRSIAMSDSTHKGMVCITVFALHNERYCIYYTFPKIENGVIRKSQSGGVNVFRLPKVPSEYRTQHLAAGGMDRETSYVYEFLAFISGQPTAYGFPYQYELIHADPPDVAK
jgi:hypothetical protein